MVARFSPDDFVEVVYHAVYLSSIKDVVHIVTDPPGRKPKAEVLALSNWFLSLSATDRAMTIAMMRKTADAAVFGFFCILDGARPITDSFSREVSATLVGEGEEIVIAPDQDLHDIFRATVDERRDIPTPAL